ncbi:MAG: zinc-dependent alcohol dehydrogenase family protein [Quisquiliibacterium sp.]
MVFDVLAFPINPADLWFCKGHYRLRPPLPATPGAECVGRVVALGQAVTGLAPGDLVINLQRENWAQRRRVRANDLVRVDSQLALAQAAMLRINPPTALLMLTDLVALKPGDWVAQNVANSAVGRWVIRLAKARGLRTLNLVRRESLFDELSALGADACVVDGPDLALRAHKLTNGAPIRLALDAVAGQATARLAECLADDGTVCTYGSMTGDDPVMPRGALIYRGVRLEGFMLGRFMATRSRDQLEAIYRELASVLQRGELSAPVAKIYPIDQIGQALAHAQQGERGGKILVAPNGPID